VPPNDLGLIRLVNTGRNPFANVKLYISEWEIFGNLLKEQFPSAPL
jgi:hypothetical protein